MKSNQHIKAVRAMAEFYARKRISNGDVAVAMMHKAAVSVLSYVLEADDEDGQAYAEMIAATIASPSIPLEIRENLSHENSARD